MHTQSGLWQETLNAELAAFEREHVLELKRAVTCFVASQLAHAKRAESMWIALRDELLSITDPTAHS